MDMVICQTFPTISTEVSSPGSFPCIGYRPRSSKQNFRSLNFAKTPGRRLRSSTPCRMCSISSGASIPSREQSSLLAHLHQKNACGPARLCLSVGWYRSRLTNYFCSRAPEIVSGLDPGSVVPAAHTSAFRYPHASKAVCSLISTKKTPAGVSLVEMGGIEPPSDRNPK